jgi:uncharacterized protein
MRVAALTTYPVKSCYRVEAPAVSVEPWGFAGDRRWIVVDVEKHHQLTQRVLPELGRVRPQPTAPGLRLTSKGAAPFDLPVPVGAPLADVHVWHGVSVAASPAGAEADAWVSEVVGQDVRLFYLDDPTRRAVNPEYARPDDRVSFADGYPVLLANAASLGAVNDWLLEDGEAPVPMTRFRPNLVIEGAPAWAEDDWAGRRLRVGAVTFRVIKACARCVLTTVDQETQDKGRQPLRVLGRHRRFPEGLLFGMNLIPDTTGRIQLADEVRLF